MEKVKVIFLNYLPTSIIHFSESFCDGRAFEFNLIHNLLLLTMSFTITSQIVFIDFLFFFAIDILLGSGFGLSCMHFSTYTQIKNF